MNWQHIIVGLGLDIFDYIGIGLIPILGDIVDLIGLAYFYFVAKIGPISAAGAVELIPVFGDLLPTFTALGVYAARKGAESQG